MSKPLTDEERAQIEFRLREGASVRAVAGEIGRSIGTVSGVAREAGIDLNVQATKKAAEARKDWAQAERLALVNRLFDKAEGMLGKCSTPRQLQQLTVAVATMIDKRRLEDGEATSRAEVSTDDVRDRISRRLDELAARRTAKGAA